VSADERARAIDVLSGLGLAGYADSNPAELFDYVAERLNRFGLAYLHIIEPRVKGNVTLAAGRAPVATEQLRKIFKGKIISAGGFQPDTAEAIVEKGDADLVAFGRHFIANPDLPKRIKLGLPLNDYDRTTFYTFDFHGYIDYPFYGEQETCDMQAGQQWYVGKDEPRIAKWVEPPNTEKEKERSARS